jgi:hypothetical protein
MVTGWLTLGQFGAQPAERSEKRSEDAVKLCIVLFAAVLALAATAATAEGIEPGLWRIINRTETGGVIGPPHESSKCLTAEQTADLGTTFSPVPATVNSVCAPIVRSLNGDKLTWRLTCKGQLNMELTGDFTFDSPHHYTAIMRTKAEMAGMQMVDSQNTLEGQWLSACPQ